LHRSDTISTLSSGYSNRQLPHRTASGSSSVPPVEEETPKIGSGPRKHRLIAPPPTIARRLDEDDSRQRAKVMYTFEKSGPEEITVEEGEEVAVVEPDDGSGWIKVRLGSATGIIPTAYVEILPPASASTPKHDRLRRIPILLSQSLATAHSMLVLGHLHQHLA